MAGVGAALCRGRSQGLLSCPRSLVTDFPQGVRECREPELGLEELLRHRCQLLQQHEEYQVRPAAGPSASCARLPVSSLRTSPSSLAAAASCPHTCLVLCERHRPAGNDGERGAWRVRRG